MNKQLKLFPPASPYYALIEEMLTVSESAGAVAFRLGSVKDKAKNPDAQVRHEALALHPDAAKTFRGIVVDNLQELLDRLDEGNRVREYAGGAKFPDDEFEHLDLTREEHVAAQVRQVDELQFPDEIADRKAFIAGLRYYVISIVPLNGETIHCFRFYSESSELQRNRRGILIKWRNADYYDEVRQPGFLFDRQIDCVCRGNDMFIINKAKFQQIFRFYDDVQYDASKAVQALHARVPLANIAEVIAASKRDSRMAIRLADLPQQPHFKRLSMMRVKRQIDRHGLPITTQFQGGVEMLVYTPASKAEFLRLICDDYVTSHMTYMDYEASEKRALKPIRHKRAASASLRVVQ